MIKHILEGCWLMCQQLGLAQLLVVCSMFVGLFIIPEMVKKIIVSVKMSVGIMSLQFNSLMFNMRWLLGGRWLATQRAKVYLSYREKDHKSIYFGVNTSEWWLDPSTGELTQ